MMIMMKQRRLPIVVVVAVVIATKLQYLLLMSFRVVDAMTFITSGDGHTSNSNSSGSSISSISRNVETMPRRRRLRKECFKTASELRLAVTNYYSGQNFAAVSKYGEMTG
jgi:hypothetical protein